jgi:hypothetical protein
MEEPLVSVGEDDGARRGEEQADAAPLETHDQETDFLSLPAFRMMCLSNPLLDTFFSSQLPASFQLEAAHRASIQGTSIWHDVPAVAGLASSSSSSTMGSPRVHQSHAPSSAPAGTTSFPSSVQSSPSSSRAYSKDVSTGVVGRLGGFLNNFLGEEIKSKVDELADSIGEKLNTKVVKGPLPSFANLQVNELGRRKSSSGTLGMDDLSAMEEQRRERRRKRKEEEQQEEEEAKLAQEKRGIDIQAAQKSLRMATESVVEGTQTGGKQFKEDVPVVAGGDEDEEEDIVGEEDIHA